MKRVSSKAILTGGRTSAWIGALLAALCGAVILLTGQLRDPLSRLSYDLPFAFRAQRIPEEVVIVYLDELSIKELKQPAGAWDRGLHAQLLERLTADHAREVVFDILFKDAGPDPAADARLAQAIKANGHVVLPASTWVDSPYSNVDVPMLELPYPPFREAAAGWGNVRVVPDSDDGVRMQFPELENFDRQARVPTLAWEAADLAGAAVTKQPGANHQERWLNYYGPPGSLPNESYYRALRLDEVPPSYFSNKVVFIGPKLAVDFAGKGQDEFATPFMRWRGFFAPGVEIQATAFLNLLHGDGWTKLPPWLEFTVILLAGLAAGFGLAKCHPIVATGLALVAVLVLTLLALLLAWYGRTWFAWVVIVPQVGVALLWSILCTSLKLYVDKQVLMESLAHNLSPACVKEILKRPELLRPGASMQDVSVLFSDIAGFSKITGRMVPEDLFELLNKYYEAALAGVHEKDGTVLQLIGDAIFAVWNAPLAQADHHERACRAALMLRDQLVQFDVRQQSLPLRTRVGLHAGPACVGNLGSSTRFEYSAIGDNTNLASRLEGLNRHLGTDILASRDIQKHVESTMLSRLVGHFKFKGVDRLLEVHELLGRPDLEAPTRAWREAFARGLFHFQRRQFDEAVVQFKLANQLRKDSTATAAGGGTPVEDGPSLFYLARIEVFRLVPPAPDWNGEIEMSEK